MESVEKRSLGELVDMLITTSIKCFMEQDNLYKLEGEAAVQCAKNIQALNLKRNQLMRAINNRVGESELSFTKKTYLGDK